MGSLSEVEDQFFDSREDITSVSDSSSDCPEILDSDSGAVDLLPVTVGYEVWVKNMSSIRERRNKFLKWMGLTVDQTAGNGSGDDSSHEMETETDRMRQDSGAVLRSSSFDDGLSSSQSSMSGWSGELLDVALEENFLCRIRNLDDGTEFLVDELGQNDKSGRIREVGTDRVLTVDEFEKSLGLSPLVRRMMRREVKEVSNLTVARKKGKIGWLRRLGSVACLVHKQVEGGRINYIAPSPAEEARTQMVRVRTHKKRCRELSALYVRQDIQAHEGSILAMKFSPDGRYLASAGEDGVVRVWEVMELERLHEFRTLDFDPSHAYFNVDKFSELVPLHGDKEKSVKSKSLWTASDSACVILPHKVFRLSDRPIHEFHGHRGEVLDVAWSKTKYLLSSSVDKTVRLWQVGRSECLQVFLHKDYVTCIQFNPMDEDYFISGSIDGKVRIWAIPGCQVVDWTDIKEIVTAVCYHPGGKSAVVGSITGNCRIYDASDGHLQLHEHICLQGKKKSPVKRITGMQFSPHDPTRLMVTSADSQVRVLSGIDVVCKYRGLHNAGSQISASFTSDGTHIVSASEDSNVYVWNYVSQDNPLSQVKKNWSCERFFSNNATIAISWAGMPSGKSDSSNISGISPSCTNFGRASEEKVLLQTGVERSGKCNLPFSSAEHLSLNHRFFSETSLKGSATWPEEKLSCGSLVASSAMDKSQYKFLKISCQDAGFSSCLGFSDCNSRLGWKDQSIPELWITSSPVGMSSSGIHH